MSFSTDLGGICLGRGDTIACVREGGWGKYDIGRCDDPISAW